MVHIASENDICVGTLIHTFIYSVLTPKVTESSQLDTNYKYVSTLTNDFIGNLSNLVSYGQKAKNKKKQTHTKKIPKS